MKKLILMVCVLAIAGCADGAGYASGQVVCHDDTGHTVKSEPADWWFFSERGGVWVARNKSFNAPGGYSCHVEGGRQ